MDFQKIKNDLKKVYDELAVYWGNDNTLHDWGNNELSEFVNLIRKNGGKRVLDLGCGSGVHSKLLTEKGMYVVGLDISRQMINEARKRAQKAKFLVGDITNLKFRENSFDGVYARASILHIPKKLIPKVFSSVYRILKKDGIFYLAVKEGIGEKEIEDERHGQKVKRFFSFFKIKELSEFLQNEGFTIILSTRFKKMVNSTFWIQVLASKAK